MDTTLQKIIQTALGTDRQRIKDMFTDLAKSRPDVFRRGAAELLKPVQDAEAKRKQREALAAIIDPDILDDALKALEKQTSEQEVLELLAGGRT